MALRYGFVMSTELGLGTQCSNWMEHFPSDMGIDPTWIVMRFHRDGGLLERVPLIPQSVKSRIRGEIELTSGLAKGPFDAVMIAVHSALALRPGYARQVPSFVMMDVTPKQLHDFGDFYGKKPHPVAAIEAYKHKRRSAAYRSCRKLFPWSTWAARSLVDDYGVNQSDVIVVPPGVDLEKWRPGDGSNAGAARLLFVGGQFERKGGATLLEWAASNPDLTFRLDIVTRDAVACADGRVHVHNGLSANDQELIELYRMADLFVLPTQADCYSIAAIEAMAAGLPVVLTAIGGTPDIIRNGKTGFLSEPGDSRGFSDALGTLINDAALRKSMGAAARADAEKRFDVRKNIVKIVSEMTRQVRP